MEQPGDFIEIRFTSSSTVLACFCIVDSAHAISMTSPPGQSTLGSCISIAAGLNVLLSDVFYIIVEKSSLYRTWHLLHEVDAVDVISAPEPVPLSQGRPVFICGVIQRRSISWCR